MRISHELLRIAEMRVQHCRDALNKCPYEDRRRRENLTQQLREAEASLLDKQQMVAAESSPMGNIKTTKPPAREADGLLMPIKNGRYPSPSL